MPSERGREVAQDQQSEQLLIGCCLLDPACHSELVHTLKPGDFYRERHRLIWAALQQLEVSRVQADTVALRDQLELNGQLHAVGGDEYLLDLTDTVPTLANAEHYAAIVRGTAAVRAVVQAALQVAAEGAEPIDDVPSYLARAEHSVSLAAAERGDERGFVTLGDASLAAYEKLVARQTGKVTDGAPVPTGLVQLDNSLGGGFWPTDLIVIAGRPGMGKSAFAMSCARAAGKRGAVAFFSLEMSADQFGMRALAGDTGIDSNLIRKSSLSRDAMRSLETARAMSDASVWIDDRPSATFHDIRRMSRKLLRKTGSISMVAIDYLQLMRAVEKSRSREEDVAEISRSLKMLAKEMRVPVVALCQMNRDAEKRGKNSRPQLSDLRESGAIEQDADVVLFIHRQEMVDRDDESARGKAEIHLAKQRSGITGVCTVGFRAETTSFVNMDWRQS